MSDQTPSNYDPNKGRKTEILDTSKLKSKKKKRRKNPFGKLDVRKILKITLFLFILCFFLGILSFAGLYLSVRQGFFGKLPTRTELKAIKNPVASEVYSSDGELLGRYYLQNRTNIEYKDISPHLIHGLVATEDARFFKHKGFDTRSYFRVLIKSILMGDRSSGGGSTISQQLIKNVFPRENHGIFTIPVMKIREAIIASRLEKEYSKEDIITMYLNTVPFGERAFGIETACRRFFSTTPKDIKIEEAATLVGMLKATTYYSPRLHPERSKGRRNVVLGQMVKYGHLDSDMARILKKYPLGLKYNKVSDSDGLAPHFRAMIKGELKEWAKNNTKSDGTAYNIYTDGLKIYTTIDASMQRYAEEAVAKHLSKLQKDFDAHWGTQDPWGSRLSVVSNAVKQSKRYKKMKAANRSELDINKVFGEKIDMNVFTHQGEKIMKMSPIDSIKYYLRFLNTGFMVMDHSNGQVKAMVGSIDHEHFPYNHTYATRQVGSTFKPIVYAAALENGTEPCRYYKNEYRMYTDYDDWAPGNSDGIYGGEYSMQGGLAKSVNTISVQVLFDTGVEKVINLAKRLGITSDIPEVPSIALGTPNLSLNEMLTAYSSFANGGFNIEPQYLVKIKDANDRTIASFKDKSKNKERVLSKETAAMMVKMMEAVVDSGTGRRLRFMYGLNNDFAGKTGTTQDQTDGWFIGMTPRYVAGAWTGGENRLIRFRDIGNGQGANMALPIFAEFFKATYADDKFKATAKREFRYLDPTLANQLDCDYFREEGWDSILIAENLKKLPPILQKRDRNPKKEESKVKQPTKPRIQPTPRRTDSKSKKKKKKKKRGWLRDLLDF